MQSSAESARLIACDVLVLPALGGERRGGAFERGAELEAALDVGDGAHRREAQDGFVGTPLDVAPGALPRDDDAVLAQPRQRLAHHRARGAEAMRELGLGGQPRVQLEFAGDDALEDARVDAAAELAFERADRTVHVDPDRSRGSAPRRRDGPTVPRALAAVRGAPSLELLARLRRRRIEAEDRAAPPHLLAARSPRTRSARTPPRLPPRRCAAGSPPRPRRRPR